MGKKKGGFSGKERELKLNLKRETSEGTGDG